MKSRNHLLFCLVILSMFGMRIDARPAGQIKTNISVEYLSNGLAYCVEQSAVLKNAVMIKLAVRFNDRWHTDREGMQAFLLEKLMIAILEDKQAECENLSNIDEAQIFMYQPELYAVPNLTLYKWEIGSPTQEQIDSTFQFLSGALETLATLDDAIIEEKLEKIIKANENSPFKPQRRQPFFEDDEEYPAASLNGLSKIFPKITATEIKNFYLENYKPQNMVLFVTGNTSNFLITKSIKSYFSFLVALEQENNSGARVAKNYFVANGNSNTNLSNYKFDMDMSCKIDTLVYAPGNPAMVRSCSETFDDHVEPKSFDKLPITENEEKIIYKIVHHLGTYNVPKLLWKKKEMERMGHSINHIHPMRFIATILSNPTLRADLQEVRRSFFKWNGFMDGFRRRMTEEFYKNNIQDYVIGFSETLGVNVEVVQHFVDRKDWEGLLKAILY